MTIAARILSWWRGREPRERAMLTVMAALIAAFAWWYGLLWPLRAMREGAAARHASAVADLHQVEAEVAVLAGSGGPSPPVGGDALQRRILDSVREAGLSPSRRRSAADGAFVLDFERVAAPALHGWLGQLAGRDGIAPSALHVERADGGLRAEVGFGGAAP